MVLTKQYVKEICRVDDGRLACSFLLATLKGFECAKGLAAREVIAEYRLTGHMLAMGDYCSGPPRFLPLKQSVH